MCKYLYISYESDNPITQTCIYIIVHSSRLAFFLCLPGAPNPQIDLGNRQTRLPISRVKIRKTAQSTFEVNSIGLRDWPNRIFISFMDKKISTCSARVSVDMYGSLCHKVYRSQSKECKPCCPTHGTYIRAHHVRVIYDDTCTRISHLIYVLNVDSGICRNNM